MKPVHLRDNEKLILYDVQNLFQSIPSAFNIVVFEKTGINPVMKSDIPLVLNVY